MATKSFSTHSFIVIPDEQYDSIMAEVMAMKPNKRKNYKGICMNKWGVKSKVIYKNNKLWNYSLLKHKHNELLPQSVEQKNFWETSKINQMYPGCSSFKDAWEKHCEDKVFMKVLINEASKNSNIVFGMMLYLGFSAEYIEDALQKHVKDSHTGNSDGRARKVKVSKTTVMHTPK